MVKRIFCGLLISSFILFLAPNFAEARTVKVRSYYKPSTGTYVESHYKTSPNKTKLDNYSTKGNSNPYSSKKGKANPFR